MTFEEFQRVLDTLNLYLGSVRGARAASTHRRVRPSAEDFAGWSDDKIRQHWLGGDRPQGPTARSRAYLLAYVSTFGSVLPVQGGRLDDGYVHWDKGAMKYLLNHKYLDISDGHFVPTPAGHAFLEDQT